MKRLIALVLTLLLICGGAFAATPQPAPTLALSTNDRAIEQRLDDLFAEIDGLSGIAVQVQAGVVSLSGSTPTPEAESRALELAQRVDGVVDVKSTIKVSADIADRAAPALERLQGFYATVMREWPIWLAALGVFSIFGGLAFLLSRFKGVFGGLAPNPFVADLVRRLIVWALVVAGLIAALDLAGAAGMMSAVIGAAGVAGLAIGFALKDTVANYIASTLLTLRRPFEANDMVRIGEHEGTVARLTPRSTILITVNGNHVSIPNGQVIQSVITNYTRRPQRRFAFNIGIGASDDAAKACRITRETLKDVAGVLSDPPPACIVKDFGDYNLVLEAAAWVDQRNDSFLSVRGLSIAAVRDALLDNGIDLPDPIVQVRRLGDAAPRPEAVQTPAAASSDVAEMAAQEPENEAAQQASQEAKAGDNLMKKAAPE